MVYKVGGSLDYNAPSYVKRKADQDLYNALKQGEFCYVLNCRQMGKSSLLVQTKYQLQNEGFKCASVDITSLGSENITSNQWYKGIITQLWRSFNLLGKVNLKQWYQEQNDLSPIQLLNFFITDILFKHLKDDSIVIFIDEIDSILSLPFSIDDFFAFIRYCYNQRAIDKEYNRITFAIFGVATPSDLIKDKKRTPFNIGKAIELNGFTLREIEPLMNALNVQDVSAKNVIKEILEWSNGQPFLTQKICKLVVETTENKTNERMVILAENESFWVKNIIESNIIDKWQYNDEPEHLRTIRDRICRNEQKAGKILELYQNILEKNGINIDNSQEQIELILSGLVVQKNGKLLVKNKIYQQVFNSQWIEEQLRNLRPYSQALKAWIESDKKDNSRLLRGEALTEAQNWSKDKSLSQLDYEYLTASEKCDRHEMQGKLETKRIKETTKLQRLLLKTITGAFFVSVGLIGISLWQYRQARLNEIKSRISEVKALISSSNGRFTSGEILDGLIDAIKAKKRIQLIENLDPKIEESVNLILEKNIYGIMEKNRLIGHNYSITDIAFTKITN
jgi:hypothetical protein